MTVSALVFESPVSSRRDSMRSDLFMVVLMGTGVRLHAYMIVGGLSRDIEELEELWTTDNDMR
jgi:hypothetical protein